jgi:NAD(P)-dependent dehydrogenase (short-subunit alcohol dehydrogenase family)
MHILTYKEIFILLQLVTKILETESSMDRIALITGANRGIGLEIGKQLLSRGFTVIFTARNMHVGRPIVNELREEYKTAWFHQLDVTYEHSIKDLIAYVMEEHGRLDVLINNAGVLLDENQSTTEVDIKDVRKTMETNVYGPLLVTRALLPALKKSSDARVINVSSTMGQFASMGAGSPAYRISKAALNALSVIQSEELAADRIRVNTIHPGWVRTDMGGPSASRSIEEGADTAVWLATEKDIPTGKYISERKEIDW